MNKLFSLFVVFLSLLSITSCEKDDSSKPIYLNVNGPDGKPAATSITITEGAGYSEQFTLQSNGK